MTALARELDEELGCRVVPGTVRVARDVPMPGRERSRTASVHAAVYAVDVTGHIAARAEIDEIRWIDPSRRREYSPGAADARSRAAAREPGDG